MQDEQRVTELNFQFSNINEIILLKHFEPKKKGARLLRSRHPNRFHLLPYSLVNDWQRGLSG
jgi:hypothetical protein